MYDVLLIFVKAQICSETNHAGFQLMRTYEKSTCKFNNDSYTVRAFSIT